ncbi:hypothetical protein A8C56_05580 [Niabella ginsenosidivorans]|uniref:Uncharacterized protein n=1 Tax=Niabella ginsenosidivorans TaxID=1176587 RepID=A0A1A9I1G0_9BACT|nr:hypothetical protein A8C56_05580 [Niabella ginsenosidivorans]
MQHEQINTRTAGQQRYPGIFVLSCNTLACVVRAQLFSSKQCYWQQHAGGGLHHAALRLCDHFEGFYK